MLAEAFDTLGLGPDVDTQTIEVTYWRLARELARHRGQHPQAAEDLERVNWAYQTLIDHRRRGPPGRSVSQRRARWLRRVPLALAAAAMVVAGAVGVHYQEQLRDAAVRGFDEAQESWDDTIAWLQSLEKDQADEDDKPPSNSITR